MLKYKYDKLIFKYNEVEGLINKRKNWRPNALTPNISYNGGHFPFGLEEVRAYGFEKRISHF